MLIFGFLECETAMMQSSQLPYTQNRAMRSLMRALMVQQPSGTFIFPYTWH